MTGPFHPRVPDGRRSEAPGWKKACLKPGRPEFRRDFQIILRTDPAPARHRNNLELAIDAAHFKNQGQPFFLGHDQVGNHQVSLILSKLAHCVVAVTGFTNSVAGSLKDQPYHWSQQLVVVNQEYLCHGTFPHRTGRDLQLPPARARWLVLEGLFLSLARWPSSLLSSS